MGREKGNDSDFLKFNFKYFPPYCHLLIMFYSSSLDKRMYKKANAVSTTQIK